MQTPECIGTARLSMHAIGYNPRCHIIALHMAALPLLMLRLARPLPAPHTHPTKHQKMSVCIVRSMQSASCMCGLSRFLIPRAVG